MVVFALVTHHVRCMPAVCLLWRLLSVCYDKRKNDAIYARICHLRSWRYVSAAIPLQALILSDRCFYNMTFCRRTGDYAAALTWLRWALEQRGRDAELQSRLGLVHLLTGDTRAAAAAFRQAAAWSMVRHRCSVHFGGRCCADLF